MRQNLWIFVALGLALLVQGLPKPGGNGELDDYQLEDPDNSPADDEDEEEAEGPAPVLLSRNDSLVFNVGDTARLSCKIQNAESATVLWWMNTSILWSDNIAMIAQDHKNFKLGEDHSLLLENIQKNDSGVYKCEVVHGGSKQIVTYDVLIAVPPKITRIIPEGAKKTVEKGTPLTLMCEASGFPTPSISWTKKTKHGEEKFDGPKIAIDAVNRKHSGSYQCLASNNNGETDVKTIEVHVLYEPEVEVEHDIVYGQEGYETELICTIHAEPKAKVSWLKDDQPLSTGHHHVTFTDKGPKHYLRISGTVKNDFGVYRCIGQNTKGTNSKTITLSGRPKQPQFMRTEEISDSNSPVLLWSIVSYTPISSFELLYREQDKGEWKPLDIEVEPPIEANRYIARGTLTGLKPGVYQAQLRAKNDFGWSELSDPHTFTGISGIDKSNEIQKDLLLEAVPASQSAGSQLRISLALVISLLVARFYCNL